MAVAPLKEPQNQETEGLFKLNKLTSGLAPVDATHADNDDLRADNDDNTPHSIKDNAITRERESTGYYRSPDGRTAGSADSDDNEEAKEKKRTREIASEMRQIAQTQNGNLFTQAAGFIEKQWDGLKELMGDAVEKAREAIGKGIAYVGDKAEQLKNLAVEKTGQAVDFAKNTASDLANGFKDGASNAFAKTKSFFGFGADKDAPQSAKAESVNPNTLLNAPEKAAPTPVDSNIITLPYNPVNVFGRAASLVGITPAQQPDFTPKPAPALNYIP